jgi:alkanesulfonate monooxygenase SsuD/methylene tetrahydromethanopterin reductase-like flavin-dependent oxidoreductase (luciferase family)
MRVGVGLPTSVPKTTPELIVEWARRADEGPYSSVGVVDRVAYDCYEPLTTLAAAAGVTERVRLATLVVIGPLRIPAVLAAAATSLHALSGGRLTLGVAVGARTEDYVVAGIDPAGRGRRLDEQLDELRGCWEDGALGARSPGGEPELLVGGTSDAAFARVARHADGYVHGGGPPRAFARAAAKARIAWADAGRPGEPVLWGQGYFALGDRARDAGLAYMRDYYAFTGPFAERIAEGLLTTPQAVVQLARGYAEEGCDELVLMPATSDPEQLDRLADVLGSAG